MPPYKTTVTCSVFNSGNDVSKQTQQISNLISQGVNAIVIDAASPTGLNGIIKQACDRGIVVVSFDNAVTAPCAQTVNTDQLKFGEQGAQFLVDRLHGKGNVIMVTGVAGTFADHERNKGALAVFKAHPDIHVVAQYSGNWDSSAAQRATAAQLPSLPKIDGVWVSGGTDGVLKAFVDAGKPLPITAGEGENGFRRFLCRPATRASRRRASRSASRRSCRSSRSSWRARSSRRSTPSRTSRSRSRSSPTRPSRTG